MRMKIQFNLYIVYFSLYTKFIKKTAHSFAMKGRCWLFPKIYFFILDSRYHESLRRGLTYKIGSWITIMGWIMYSFTIPGLIIQKLRNFIPRFGELECYCTCEGYMYYIMYNVHESVLSAQFSCFNSSAIICSCKHFH